MSEARCITSESIDTTQSQVGNEVHLIPQLYLAIQCRDVRIERLHAAGEFGFLSAAAVDENPVETPAQQTDGFGAQLFGISLARLGGERRETDPYTLLFLPWDWVGGVSRPAGDRESRIPSDGRRRNNG